MENILIFSVDGDIKHRRDIYNELRTKFRGNLKPAIGKHKNKDAVSFVTLSKYEETIKKLMLVENQEGYLFVDKDNYTYLITKNEEKHLGVLTRVAEWEGRSAQNSTRDLLFKGWYITK